MKKTFLIIAATAALCAAGKVSYSYDAAGRLVKADYGSAGSIAYEYDKAGNLIKRTTQGPNTAPSQAQSPAQSKQDPQGKKPEKPIRKARAR